MTVMHKYVCFDWFSDTSQKTNFDPQQMSIFFLRISKDSVICICDNRHESVWDFYTRILRSDNDQEVASNHLSVDWWFDQPTHALLMILFVTGYMFSLTYNSWTQLPMMKGQVTYTDEVGSYNHQRVN